MGRPRSSTSPRPPALEPRIGIVPVAHKALLGGARELPRVVTERGEIDRIGNLRRRRGGQLATATPGYWIEVEVFGNMVRIYIG